MFEKISLDKFRPQTFETREIGTVIEVKKAIATIVGLPFCLYGQMVHFPNDLAGMVVGFDEEKVMALVLGDETQLKSGDEVIGKAEPFQVPVGERFVGRIVDAILNQRGKDVICIYCCVGRSEASLSKVVQLLKERGAMEYTIVAAATAARPPGEQFLIPYTACTLGEYFMGHGRDVLVVFDDLTKHAWVHRQISLLLERSPGREAYPGDVFYIHSQLLERAGRLRAEIGGGTMTFLPIVETQQGDVTGHIPSNLISITDGQIYMSASLFTEGFRPAIDFGLSVSRIGNKIQCEAMKELSRKLRLEYVQYKSLQRLTNVQSTLSAEAEARLKSGEAMTHILTQDKNRPASVEEQIVLLYALKSPAFAGLDARGWKQVKVGIVPFLLDTRSALIRDIAAELRLTPRTKERLEEGLAEFLKSPRAQEDEA